MQLDFRAKQFKAAFPFSFTINEILEQYKSEFWAMTKFDEFAKFIRGLFPIISELKEELVQCYLEDFVQMHYVAPNPTIVDSMRRIVSTLLTIYTGGVVRSFQIHSINFSYWQLEKLIR